MGEQKQDAIVPARIFDYGALAPEQSSSLQDRAERIAQREKVLVENILANGKEYAAARDELRHNKAGGFEGWLAHHGFSRSTAYLYINAWETYGNCPTVGQLQPTALLTLSAPSTPEPARQEAGERAKGGERITAKTAKEITSKYKAPKGPTEPKAQKVPTENLPVEDEKAPPSAAPRVNIKRELLKTGSQKSRDDLLNILKQVRASLWPSWSADKIMCHHIEALHFCEEVRKHLAAHLPDHVILQALLSIRKNPEKPKKNPKEPGGDSRKA